MIYQDRSTSGCVKYNRQYIKSICSNPDAWPFWVADMDFRCPEAVNEALVRAAGHGVFGYPSADDTARVASNFISWRHGTDIDSSLIVPTTGVLNSLSILMENTSRGVIIPFPAYKPFVSACETHGRSVSPWALSYDGKAHRFCLDFAALEKLCSSGENDLLIFCSPHNPSGMVFSPEELRRVSEICAAGGVQVICDEIHADLTYDGFRHTSFLQAARGTGARAVTLMAPSKTFNLAGEHFSLAIFPDNESASAYKSRLQRLHNSGPSYVDNLMARAAYAGGRDWLEDCIRTISSNADLVDSFIRSRIPLLGTVRPEASFVCFIDCSQIFEAVLADQDDNPELYRVQDSPDATALSRFFGVRCSVAVNPGTFFGPDYGQFVRFNFGTSTERVLTALQRMEAGINKLTAV